MRDYRWQSLRGQVQLWYERQRLTVLELPALDIDATSGSSHTVPRASTLLVKLRYEDRISFGIVVTPARSRANLTAIRKACCASTAWVSTVGEVQAMTRSVPGCVPAFGSIFGLPVMLDARLTAAPEIFAPSGRPGYAVLVPVDYFMRLERPLVIDFAGPATPVESDAALVSASVPQH